MWELFMTSLGNHHYCTRWTPLALARSVTYQPLYSVACMCPILSTTLVLLNLFLPVTIPLVLHRGMWELFMTSLRNHHYCTRWTPLALARTVLPDSHSIQWHVCVLPCQPHWFYSIFFFQWQFHWYCIEECENCSWLHSGTIITALDGHL